MVQAKIMTFNGIEITQKTILRTREHFADIYRGCVEDAQNGIITVNDLPRYIAQNETAIKSALAGGIDHTFTFRQRAHWLQTGECVPLLPK